MQKIYYIFISIVTFITIFITIFSEYSITNSTITLNKYYWPAPGFKSISSYFGNREKPTNGASTNHKGIDILASKGSSVHAIADGVVTYASFDKSGGYMIIISHQNKIKSSYAHLDPSMNVEVGDTVLKGDIIGKVGPKYLQDGRLNGATTGVHLHLGISKNNEYVNPLNFF